MSIQVISRSKATYGSRPVTVQVVIHEKDKDGVMRSFTRHLQLTSSAPTAKYIGYSLIEIFILGRRASSLATYDVPGFAPAPAPIAIETVAA